MPSTRNEPPRLPKPVAWEASAVVAKAPSPSPTTGSRSITPMASGRLLHVVVTDALSLDNGVARLRVLIAAEPSNPPDLSAVLAS